VISLLVPGASYSSWSAVINSTAADGQCVFAKPGTVFDNFSPNIIGNHTYNSSHVPVTGETLVIEVDNALSTSGEYTVVSVTITGTGANPF
jgi:hypothetical protein